MQKFPQVNQIQMSRAPNYSIKEFHQQQNIAVLKISAQRQLLGKP